MMVVEISPVTQSRFLVRTDTEESFILYKGELKKYGICEGRELPDATYEEIVGKLLKMRARKRAMNLLERADRTEQELLERLEKDGYPACCIADAVAYVRRFGYLNDDRYMEVFIRSKASRKSRREIEYLLVQKGFSRDVVSKKLDSMMSEVSDRGAIETLMRKKNFDPNCADRKKKDKMIQYLMRKGFGYRDICHVIQISNDDA